MNREQRRAQNKQLAKDNQSWPSELVEWPRSEWPASVGKLPGSPERLWRSRLYLVQQYPAIAPALCRLSVNIAARPGERWADGITWEQLQQIKRQVGYGGFDAVEVYPDDDDVVNVSNMRHLWILEPGSLPFAWRK
jgi:hypothetical protein